MFIKRGTGTIIGTLHDAQELSEEQKASVQEKTAHIIPDKDQVIPVPVPVKEENN